MSSRNSGELGWCVWITGLPGSGKSVVSEALLKTLADRGVRVQLLSSDALRRIMTPDPSYSLEERDNVYATLVFFARILTQNGVNVLIDATGNLRRYRDEAREQVAKFFEVYLECPLEICVKREDKRKKTHHAPSRIYSKAFEGKASTVPGIGQPYESPLAPDATVNTTLCSPVECAKQILRNLPIV